MSSPAGGFSPVRVERAPLNDGLGGTGNYGGMTMKFEHGGKIYATAPATGCDNCVFYWRDGGIYDACEHPDQEFVKKACGRDQRANGNNVMWMKLKPWMTLDHCPECRHKGSQHDMNCIECCPVARGGVTPNA